MLAIERFFREIDDRWGTSSADRVPLRLIGYDARADDVPTYCANLNRVERDFLAVDETEIELPSWIR